MYALTLLRLFRLIVGRNPVDVREIENMGLLAVKIAQTFALRADFLPPERCQELAQLYRSARPVPAEDLERLLALSMDDQWRSHFRSFDPVPFAAASVGQVHRGTLQDGTDVAVKLLKADVARAFRKDVRSAERIMNVILTFYPLLRGVADPEGILETIREGTLDELDLRIEVEHAQVLQDLQEYYGQIYDLSDLRFPRVFQELSSERVLVTELINGASFDELLDRGELPYDQLLRLFRIHGFFCFCVGTFHGDIHPGNILLSDGTIVFVDTGALGRVSQRMRTGLLQFMRALSQDDFDSCAKALNDMAVLSIEGPAYDQFHGDLLALYADYPGKTVSEVSLTRQMMRTIRLGVESGMRFERGMYPIIKSLMYMDGMVLRCNPHAILMRDMQPFVAEFDAAQAALAALPPPPRYVPSHAEAQ